MRSSMPDSQTFARTLSLGLFALAALPSAASAQYIGAAPPPPAPPIRGMVEYPSAALARNVRLLALSPRSFEALIGAGRAALALGDTQAAVGFFGRAEEVYPRSPAPKAGTAAALVAMEQPVEALGYFEEAVRLGANQASIGADRGLAYDLTGEPLRAQADYRAALFGQDRDEARRRLALSLAMGRDRAGALATLAPLMARRDPATERVRAFVFALVGDVPSARRVVDAAMPGASANMAPFLTKLARMSRDQQLAAVHFGRFPDDSAIRMAAASAPPIVPPQATSRGSATRAPDRVAARVSPPLAMPSVTQSVAPPAALTVAPLYSPPQPTVVAVREPDLKPAASAEPTPAKPEPGPVEIAAASSTPAIDRLGDIDRLLETSEEPIVAVPAAASDKPMVEEAAPPRTKPKVETAAEKRAAKKAKAKPDELAPAPAKPAAKIVKSPGKYWVQLAGGSKTDRMPIEYKRIKGKKPALFAKRTAYVAELKGWTRLLVGPFKSEDESQLYVNQLANARIDGFSWTSPNGQAIEKLPPK